MNIQLSLTLSKLARHKEAVEHFGNAKLKMESFLSEYANGGILPSIGSNILGICEKGHCANYKVWGHTFCVGRIIIYVEYIH